MHERKDLMSSLLSTVLLELKGKGQRLLICAIYREFNVLTGKGQMPIEQQIERWMVFKSQFEQAKKENSFIMSQGDMNINLEQLEENDYYLKRLAEKYQNMVSDFQLEVLDFGPEFTRMAISNSLLLTML